MFEIVDSYKAFSVDGALTHLAICLCVIFFSIFGLYSVISLWFKKNIRRINAIVFGICYMIVMALSVTSCFFIKDRKIYQTVYIVKNPDYINFMSQYNVIKRHGEYLYIYEPGRRDENE